MKKLFLVHCVDTEGPLYESLTATFERVNQTFDFDFKPSTAQLKRLRAGKDLPDKLQAKVMDFVSSDRLNYNSTWTEVDVMLHELMSDKWRMQHADDFGNGYIFSWFVMDHVGYTTNPRQRALGFHSVYAHYKEMLAEYLPKQDALYWHFHPVPFSYAANRASCNYSFTSYHIESISRRVLDHLDFPAAFRPGLHCERPDIHMFLEMWIPVDYGNQGMPATNEDELQKDVFGGRFGDWRRAKSEWGVYHPDWYDYQKNGSMKRYIARCLNLNARLRAITEEEIEKAFQQVQNGEPTILSVTSHDQNKMAAPITEYMDRIRMVQQRYPEVKICHANAIDAVRHVCNVPSQQPVNLQFSWSKNRLDVVSDKDIWGPQPWMCFKTLDGRYLHENMDRQAGNHWSFTFDIDSIELQSLDAIAFATNDNYFNSSVYRLSITNGVPCKTESRFYNQETC